jgi:hypothetical protein
VQRLPTCSVCVCVCVCVYMQAHPVSRGTVSLQKMQTHHLHSGARVMPFTQWVPKVFLNEHNYILLHGLAAMDDFIDFHMILWQATKNRLKQRKCRQIKKECWVDKSCLPAKTEILLWSWRSQEPRGKPWWKCPHMNHYISSTEPLPTQQSTFSKVYHLKSFSCFSKPSNVQDSVTRSLFPQRSESLWIIVGEGLLLSFSWNFFPRRI